MERIILSESADFWEVYRKLSKDYFDEVERMIARRLPQTILVHRDKFEGADEVITGVLKDGAKRLQELIPGAGVFWDERLDIVPTYKDYPIAVVDVVDGSAELRRGGTEVASTLAVVFKDGRIPLSVISYPFGRERVIDVNGKVYRVPNSVLDEIDSDHELLEKYRLPFREPRTSLGELRVSERYEFFKGDVRKKLDDLRHLLRISIKRPIGSISKNLMSLVTGSCDIFMVNGEKQYHFYDTLPPGKIITDMGGVFVDMHGKPRDGLNPMDGIIAASTQDNYKMFMEYMNS